MPTLAEKLNEAETILRASSIVDPRREASSLIAIALKRDKTFLIAHPEYLLTATECETLDEFIRRRAAHEPLQYISGVQEFYGLDFEVTPDVLIPRPETEMVVERAVELLRASVNGSFLDVGTGSGCIAVAVLHQVQGARAVGLDLSRRALEVARRNAEKHHVSARFKVIESDIFSSVRDEKFDLIVSNPPYVPANDIPGLQAEVRDFEPHTALTDSSDGLSIIRRIVRDAPQYLSGEGHLLLEIGFDQSDRVAAMFDPEEWRPPELFPDLQGIPRLVSARLR